MTRAADPAAGGRTAALTAAWLLAWLVTAALLAAVHYTSGDPDSRLYAGISARLVDEPVVQWIAPEWWGFWGLTGPYHEHPVGMFVVPAALGRLGYPAGQAAYAVNALYQVITFVLVALIAAAVVPRRDASALSWLLQLLPIAFVFRVRANQEYAVLAGLLFALYACERARRRPAWAVGMLAGFTSVLLVKGVFALMVPLTCVLWLLARGPVSVGPSSNASAPPWSRASALLGGRASALLGAQLPLAAWAAVLLMPLVGLAVTWAYELAYVHVTGRSFLEIYRARQVPEGAITSGSPLVRTAYTLVWYAGRVAWFAFPWSLVAGAAILAAVRAGTVWPWTHEGHGLEAPRDARLTAHGSRLTDVAAEELREGAWFAAAATIALVVAFSFAHRKADRYIFPAYFFAGAVGSLYAVQRLPVLQRVVARFDRPWVPAAIYVLLVLLRLATRGTLPEFTFWRS